jgi:hypothetical protein
MNGMGSDLSKLALFDALKRGTLIHIHTEDGLFWIETVVERRPIRARAA